MSKHTGGPAFPRPESPAGKFSDVNVPPAQEGMTLRDYFAAKALATISAYNPDDAANWLSSDFASHAYAIADAMLAERAK